MKIFIYLQKKKQSLIFKTKKNKWIRQIIWVKFEKKGIDFSNIQLKMNHKILIKIFKDFKKKFLKVIILFNYFMTPQLVHWIHYFY
jgi:hypothetical protein